MEINETVNFSSQVTTPAASGGAPVETVAYLSAFIDGSNGSVTVSVNSLNKKLITSENKANIQEQYASFDKKVKERAIELGYTLF